jgi:hydrogenase nickel incorporation protein HypA/HybF
MHELSLSRAIVDTAVRHAGGRRVTGVSLRVGALRQVVPPALDFAFGVVAAGTACEGARLEQELVPARLRCDACAAEWEIAEPAFRCPTCGAAARVVAGEELEVESINVEEVACTAPR